MTHIFINELHTEFHSKNNSVKKDILEDKIYQASISFNNAGFLELPPTPWWITLQILQLHLFSVHLSSNYTYPPSASLRSVLGCCGPSALLHLLIYEGHYDVTIIPVFNFHFEWKKWEKRRGIIKKLNILRTQRLFRWNKLFIVFKGFFW